MDDLFDIVGGGAGPSSPAGSSYSSKSSRTSTIKQDYSVMSPATSSVSSKSSRSTKKAEFDVTPTTTIISSGGGKPMMIIPQNQKKKKSTTKSQSTKGRTKTAKVKVNNAADPDSKSNVGQVNEDEYIVEKIVAKRITHTEEGSIPMYLIKWKGWANAHNTWEPVENLDGCPDLLVKYEKSLREKKRAKNAHLKKDGELSDSDSDDDLVEHHYESTDEMEKSRNELIEYGIAAKWPTARIPLELMGVVNIDNHLTYMVRCLTLDNEDVQELSEDNVVLIRATGFKSLFPHIVIAFYEKNVLWIARKESKEEIKDKAEKLVEKVNTEQTEEQRKAEKSMSVSSIVSGGGTSLVSHVGGGTSAISGGPENVNNGESDMEVDDEDNLPKISIKSGKDLYGLPESMESSESSSDDDYSEIFLPLIKK